jgi:peptidoglycan/LPS O-acetylase OafA/YrhL
MTRAADKKSMRDAGGRDRLLYLDGLRAIAVLSVVVYHAWQYAGEGGPPFIARICQMGAHGVDLFFVLSGFCLAYPYLRRVRAHAVAEFSTAAFAAKRFVRIVPPYWLALGAVVILGLINVLAQPPPMLDILKQLVFLDRDVRFAATPFWTLPLEFRWYFLFPLALVAYARAPRLVLAVAVGSYVLYDQARMNAIPDFGTFPAFLAGIWLADLHLTRSPLQRLALPVFLAYGAIAFAFEPDLKHQFYAAEPLGVGTVMAFVALAGTNKVLGSVLAQRAFTTVGAASYGIYLLHDPILKRLETVDHVAPWLAAIAAVAISLVFSYLCERPFVEGPARTALLRFLEPRFSTLFAWLGIPALLTLPAPHSHRNELELEAGKVA